MDEDKDSTTLESSDKTSHDENESIKNEKNLENSAQEVLKDSNLRDDDSFKFPSDVAFKKPIFIKPTKKSAKTDLDEQKSTEVEELTGQTEEIKQFSKSPAEQLVEKLIPLPYKEPAWSGLPKLEYSFEVLKNGVIVEAIPLNKPYFVIGRLAQCDIVMEHPSLSRFHCIIQYRAESTDEQKEGFYAYDLASTHGSFHNKHRMKPKTYYRLHVGHMIKFGGSSRTLLLQGPDEDQELESELSVTELKAEAAKRAEKLHRLEMGESEDEENRDKKQKEVASDKKGKEESEGIDWGMGEDAVEDEDEEGESSENPFAVLNEDLYLNDPKKTLRGWFEREGYEFPEYVAEDVSPGVYRCKVELPIPGPGGGALIAIAENRGRKKAVVIQCALEACRLLDRRGLLRQAQHDSHEKKGKDWAKNDYYDSDEDDFLDRTGDVQRKRLRRMKTIGGKESVAETFESLIVKYNEVIDELSSLEDKLLEAERIKECSKGVNGDEDDLDSYMRNLKSQVPDKHKRVNWKLKTIELRKEEMRLRRLANVAKPFDKAELQPYSSKYDTKQKSSTRSPFQKPTDYAKDGLKELKTHGFKVHKVFTEEEPEEKIKLRRLDEEGYEIKPVKYSVPKPKPKLNMKTPFPERKGNESSMSVIDSSDNLKNAKKETCHSNKIERLGEPSSSDYSNVDTCVESKFEEKNERERKRTTETKSPEVEEETALLKKPRLLGPTLPPNLEYLKAVQEESTKMKKKTIKKATAYTEDSANYETWVPPSNQTGDGRTSLNEKYGY